MKSPPGLAPPGRLHYFHRMKFPVVLLTLALTASAQACELCAIYGAATARGENSSGFMFTVAEQYVAMCTPQFDSEPFEFSDDYVNSSYLHLVPTFNFSARFGVSLNLPYIHRDFERQFVHFGGPATQFGVEKGTESGLGDLAAALRWTAFTKQDMNWGLSVNLLGGVKFPTGDDSRLEEEVEQVRIYNRIAGPGHFHDALGVLVSGVHQSHLTLGSGSFDGIFGVTGNARYRRGFFNAQAQYYLRTEGDSGYTYGNEMIFSGGPGLFLWLGKRGTFSLAANFVYDSEARAELFERKSNSTGMTVVYGGPQFNFTWGSHFSVQGGADLPIRIINNGFQNVPDYRAYGGLTWRF